MGLESVRNKNAYRLGFPSLPFLGQLPKCCISELEKGVGFGFCTDSTFTELLSSFTEQHWPHSSLLGCNGRHCMGSLDPELCIKLQLADALILPAISSINL